MKIVDSHHHLWNIDELYYPWLTDAIRPVAYGDYSAIRKNYLLSDFRCDIGTLDVVKSVHVEAGHDPRHPVVETRWLQEIADDPRSNGFPHAIVAFVDLSRPDAAKIVDQHQKFANVRGIRQMLHFGPGMSFLSHDVWRRNVAELSGRALSFDLQIQPAQMELAAEVIELNPDLQFILDHAGCPPTPPNDDRSWASGLERLSMLPNLVVKLSGFGMSNPAWTAASIEPIVRRMLGLFGVERCMFGSNFPVESLMKDYHSTWAEFGKAVSHLSSFEQELLFAKNAERVYRI